MHSDHFHPGWNVIRATVAPLSRSTSIVVLSGVRVSSGVSNDFELTPGIVALHCVVLSADGAECPFNGPSRRGLRVGRILQGGHLADSKPNGVTIGHCAVGAPSEAFRTSRSSTDL